MKEIELTQGKVALVDDLDYEFLMRWSWFAHKRGKLGKWYAARTDRTGKQKTVSMHCVLVSAEEVDHKNGNGLDNQRHNLRACTSAQNAQNRKTRSDNTSGYKGVHWRSDSQKWRAQIVLEGRYTHIGTFSKLIDAAVAYDAAAQIFHGNFARLNFSYDPACFI